MTLETIWLFDGNLDAIVQGIEDALVAHDPEIFQRDGALYWLGASGPAKADAHLLRLRAMRIASFLGRRSKNGWKQEVDPPLKYFLALLRKRDWKFPLLGQASDSEGT